MAAIQQSSRPQKRARVASSPSADAATIASYTHEGIFCDACAERSAEGLVAIVGERYTLGDVDYCLRCFIGLSPAESAGFVLVPHGKVVASAHADVDGSDGAGEAEEESESESESRGSSDDNIQCMREFLAQDRGLIALDAQIAALENAPVSSSDDGESEVYGVEESVESEEDHYVEASLVAIEYGAHGEMSVSQAQRTPTVRVPGFVDAAEVAQILKSYVSLRDKCGLATQKHGEASSNWTTTFLHTDGNFVAALPLLRQKVLDAAIAVDAQQGWGLLDTGAPFALRVVEIHTVGPGGSLPEHKHFDHGSLVTVDVMLSDSANGAFEGGELCTLEQDGKLHAASPFELGDATVFVSHKYHCVTPVTKGTRQVLVCEIWHGPERECAHRCEQHEGECPITLAVSRAASHMVGFLDEGAYGHFLNETCDSLQSDRASERAEAAATLARVMALCEAVKARKTKKKKKAGGAGGASASTAEGDDEFHAKEMVALRNHINERAAVRANHYDMDGADDDW